jgi:hypothetical protein
MGITLDNTDASGSVDITLNVVSSYELVHTKKWYKRTVAGSTSPVTDTTSYVYMPRQYRITAYVTNTEKGILLTLQSEIDKQIKLADGALSDRSVRLESLTLSANVGHTTGLNQYPWIADIVLTAEDH